MSATMVIIAFTIVMFKTLFNGVSIGTIDFGTIDSALAGVILTPVLGTYAVRRIGSPQGSQDSPVRSGRKAGDGYS